MEFKMKFTNDRFRKYSSPAIDFQLKQIHFILQQVTVDDIPVGCDIGAISKKKVTYWAKSKITLLLSEIIFWHNFLAVLSDVLFSLH